jgi:hypothetical protein
VHNVLMCGNGASIASGGYEIQSFEGILREFEVQASRL